MRIFRAEFGSDYPSYAFGYTEHAELEEAEAPALAYEAGYLPASADPRVTNRFYMARSVRVPLQGYEPTSENRRILRKFDGAFEQLLLERKTLSSDPEFRDCFLTYFADKHGQSVMSEERLEGILHTALPLRGIRYEKDGQAAAYVLEVIGEGFAHYWFSCHDMQYAGTSLGMWLMLDAVRRAQEEGRSHLYLGTAYGKKGRYKMNISPLSFWDGSAWSDDEKRLKQLIALDPE